MVKTMPISLLLALAVLLIYGSSMDSPFHLDDYHAIVENHGIKSLSAYARPVLYAVPRSLTNLSFALNYRFGGLETGGYHVVNIAIHMVNGLLVYWLALLLLSNPVISPGDKNDRAKHWLSLGAALVFVSHPVQTQAVTYIVQRLTSMAAMFYLLAVCLYIKGRYIHTSAKGRGYLWCYAGTAVSGLAAFLSKEISFTLPVMLLMAEFFFIRKDDKINAKLLASGLAAVVLAVIIGLVFKMAPTRETGEIGRWQYLITQFRVIVTYLRLLAVPVNQNLDYDFALSRSLWEVPTLLSGVFLLTILSAGAGLYRKYRLISFGIFWFFLALSVESSVIPIRDVIFEHRMYLPLAGYGLVLAGVFYYLKDRIKPRIAVIIWASLTIGLGASAWARNQVWRDDLLLWHDTVAKSPGKARPHLNRGNALMSLGIYGRALSDYEIAVELDPAYAEAYYNRGLIYAIARRYDLARRDLLKAVELKPEYLSALINLGNTYNDTGEYPEAIEYYTKALEIDGNDANALCNRGLAHYRRGDRIKALKDYDRCLAADSTFMNGYLNRGLLFLSDDRNAQALADLDRYISVTKQNPRAYYYRSQARLKTGDTLSAGEDLKVYNSLSGIK